VILDAARLAPDLKFIVRSLAQTPSRLPPNVRIAPAVKDHTALYDRGDVCVQPSHYEGLGLQLLECQAAGMPLITTAAPPMNEVQPWQVIPVRREEVIHLWGNFFAAACLTPEDLVETLRPLVGRDLREASRGARAFVETEHGWEAAQSLLLAELAKRS
jgi:glycosyltransferase involved in cell wall biosynthesis